MRQLDFFVPIVGLAKPKDQQDIMSYPSFSLSKSKRTKPIKFERNGNTIEIRPDAEFGMATIWDADILMYFASYIKYLQNNEQDIPPKLSVTAYDVLTFTGRSTGKRGYELLRKAFRRLKHTQVITNIRQGDRKHEHHFSWVSEFEEYTRLRMNPKTGEKERVSDRIEVQLPNWFVEGVLDDRLVLTISPQYFQLTGGYQRWLYRFVRKHCGQQDEFNISLGALYNRSGKGTTYKDFARRIRETVEQGIPEYQLNLIVQGKQKRLFAMRERVYFDNEDIIAISKPQAVDKSVN